MGLPCTATELISILRIPKGMQPTRASTDPTPGHRPERLTSGMAKTASSKSVPKGMQATYEAITTLTDAFCRDHMNDEYRELAQRMTAALCRK